MERKFNGKCEKCNKYMDVVFDKDEKGEPIYSMESDDSGLTDLLATAKCECGYKERVIIYGKALSIPINEEN